MVGLDDEGILENVAENLQQHQSDELNFATFWLLGRNNLTRFQARINEDQAMSTTPFAHGLEIHTYAMK